MNSMVCVEIALSVLTRTILVRRAVTLVITLIYLTTIKPIPEKQVAYTAIMGSQIRPSVKSVTRENSTMKITIHV